MKKYADEDIVQRLQSGDNRIVDETLYYLHGQVYAMVVRFVRKYKGTLADAEDNFQDSLIALYKLARQGKLQGNTNVEAYLYAINKNLWFKQLKKRKETLELPDDAHAIPVPEVALYSLLSEERKAAIEKLLAQLGESCHRLLVYYFYDRLKLKKIAQLMEYASEQVAKNKKSACMRQLKTLLSQHPHYKKNIT
ncbi:MAG TPA: sigma-70 family RNA polymerase sigma factor [Bacteroidetes bacterium]|nr:sigma-70 family RNA polymerase sigma factor [Bacteroidota bacterium]